jgi:cytochrome c-type biogenesis protein CcmE
MKKSHIFALIVIAVAVMIIISTAGDASTYVTFSQAKEMSINGNSSKIHVVGELTKNEIGEVVGLKSSDNLLSFTFTMKDEENNIQNVFYSEPMPHDFLRSEKIVVIGAYRNEMFVADKILLKCPSKYQETEIKTAGK